MVRSKRAGIMALIICIVCIFGVFISCIKKVRASAYTEKYVNVSSSGTLKTVIIDAGHGGEDPGAIGSGNIYEKDLNLAIAFKLGDYLKSAGYNVVYTRTDDRLLYTEEENIKGMRKIYDLKNRVKIANSYSDALLVSIHMNSFGAENCSGLQVYYSKEDSESVFIAESVQNSVVKKIQPSNKRKVKSGEDLFVLENSANPAILIECGFVSNPTECKKLSEKEYQKELSFAILCGIIEYDKGKNS